MKLLMRALAAGLALMAGASALAQDFPTRPIRMIVPFAAGGPTDVIGRQVAQRMGQALGQSIVVDNRTGAGSTLGTDVVAKAPADGYTLLFGTFSMAVNATLYPKLPYDPINDFASIGKVANTYLVLVTHPSFPARNLRELVDAVKVSPGRYNFGSAGIGSGLHLAAEMLHSRADIKGVTHVPYRGNAPMVPALIAGELSYGFLGMDAAVPHIRSGKLKAIAVTSNRRDRLLPDVPTVAESGLNGFEVGIWMVVQAPKGTPAPVVRKLNDALNRALASPEFVEMANNFAGLVPMGPSSPEQADAFVRDEIRLWAPVVRASGAKPE